MSKSKSTSKSKTCLIVDDSHVVRRVQRRIIEDLGFECHEAANGQEALDFCKKTMPAAVLLDWQMPIMDGLEFVENLRVLDDGKKPKVIFCSTEFDDDKIKQAKKEGADEYIVKPFDNGVIREKFKKVGLI